LPPAQAELEAECLGLHLPMLDKVAEPCVSLGTAGPKGCELHSFRCAVAMNAGRLLDGLAPLGEGPLDIARDGGNPECILLPLELIDLTFVNRTEMGFVLSLIKCLSEGW
jgi:hypothetical protein